METKFLSSNHATTNLVNEISRTGQILFPVLSPDIQLTAVEISVPWFVRNSGTKTMVSVPQLSVHPVGVYIPIQVDMTGDVIYSYQLWEEQIVSWKTGFVFGRIKYYKLETWCERRIVYMPSQMQINMKAPQSMIRISESRIRNWEKVSMAVFGGSYEDVNIIATPDAQFYSGISAKFNGLGGLIPSLLGNISIGKATS